MDCLSNEIIAAKGKGDIAQTARRAHAGQMRVDPSNRFDEIYRIVSVLVDSGANGKYVRVKYDVARI